MICFFGIDSKCNIYNITIYRSLSQSWKTPKSFQDFSNQTKVFFKSHYIQSENLHLLQLIGQSTNQNKDAAGFCLISLVLKYSCQLSQENKEIKLQHTNQWNNETPLHIYLYVFWLCSSVPCMTVYGSLISFYRWTLHKERGGEEEEGKEEAILRYTLRIVEVGGAVPVASQHYREACFTHLHRIPVPPRQPK